MREICTSGLMRGSGRIGESRLSLSTLLPPAQRVVKIQSRHLLTTKNSEEPF
jgi:hypothetical protein